MDDKISLVFNSNLNFSKTDSQRVTVEEKQWRPTGIPTKILYNKPADPLRKLTLHCQVIFALVSLSKLGSRTAHEAALPQNFIFYAFQATYHCVVAPAITFNFCTSPKNNTIVEIDTF